MHLLPKIIVSFLLCCSVAWSAPLVLGNSPELVGQKMELFVQLSSRFMQICTKELPDKSFNFLENEIQSNLSISEHDGAVDCNEQLLALKTYKDEILRGTEELEKITTAESCEEEDGQEPSGIEDFLGNGSELAPALMTSCDGQNSQDATQCAEDFACDFMAVIKQQKGLKGELLKKDGSPCPKYNSANSCLFNAEVGFINSMGSFFKSIGTTLEWTAEKKSLISANIQREAYQLLYPNIPIADDVVPVLTESDYKAMERMRVFILGFPTSARDMGVQLWNSISEASKDINGCLKWEGRPFASRCITSVPDFCGASCAKKKTMVCGVVGYLGGVGETMMMGSVAGILPMNLATRLGGAVLNKTGAAGYLAKLKKTTNQARLQGIAAAALMAARVREGMELLPEARAIDYAYKKMEPKLKVVTSERVRIVRAPVPGVPNPLYHPIKEYNLLAQRARDLASGGNYSKTRGSHLMAESMDNERLSVSGQLFTKIPTVIPKGSVIRQNRDGKFFFMNAEVQPHAVSGAFKDFKIKQDYDGLQDLPVSQLPEVLSAIARAEARGVSKEKIQEAVRSSVGRCRLR